MMEKFADKIADIDLTQYKGPWPPPADYGLTQEQFDHLQEATKSYSGKFVFFLPILAFILPNNLYELFPPLGWIMRGLSYLFPVMRVVGDSYPNGGMAQTVFGVSIIGILAVLPSGVRRFISITRKYQNCSKYSLIMFSLRRSAGNLNNFSPKGLRQLLSWGYPIAFFVLIWIFVCDVIGYAQLYLIGKPLLEIAQTHAVFGGILSGLGWFHGAIYSYTADNRPQGMGISHLGIFLQALGIQMFLLGEVGFFAAIGTFLKDFGKWRGGLKREEPYLTKLYLQSRKNVKTGH